jgi:hypothetical protein
MAAQRAGLIFLIFRVEELDAEAGVHVLLVAGVCVEIVGGAAVELIALAEFATNEKTESDGTETGGDPADSFDESGLLILFFVALFVSFEAGEWERGSSGDLLGCGVFSPRFGTEDHALNDSAGS